MRHSFFIYRSAKGGSACHWGNVATSKISGSWPRRRAFVRRGEVWHGARQADCQDTARRSIIKSNCYSRLALSRCEENCAVGTLSFILICCLMRNNGRCGDAAPSRGSRFFPLVNYTPRLTAAAPPANFGCYARFREIHLII